MNSQENKEPQKAMGREFRIVERVEDLDYWRQRFTRTLYEDGEEVFKEVDCTGAYKGSIAEILKSIDDLYNLANNCQGCKYRVGEYRGDICYLLYLAFKYRLRAQIFMVKLRLCRLFGIKPKLLKKNRQM